MASLIIASETSLLASNVKFANLKLQYSKFSFFELFFISLISSDVRIFFAPQVFLQVESFLNVRRLFDFKIL